MIGYVTIGVSDMERAKTFYSDLLGDIGAKVLMDMGRIAFIGKRMSEPMLAVCTPYNEQPHEPGNGTMVALRATTGTLAWMTSLKAGATRFVDIDSTPAVSGSITANR